MENILLNIKEIRKSLNLTQTELALKCGVHLRTIQNWEKEPAIIPYTSAQYIRSLIEGKYAENSHNIFPSSDTSPSTLSEAPVVSKDSAGQFAGKDVSFSGHNNNVVGKGTLNNSIGNDAALLRALDEIAEQRKLTQQAQASLQKAQEQIDRLLSLLEQERRERKE